MLRQRKKRAADSSIDWLIGKFREHLYVADPIPYYVLYGAVAANMLEGEPVWPMLVGPSGSGKTELLNSLLGLPHIYEAVKITNDAAFLSATVKKERAGDATGGLFRQVGDHGGLVMNDFTSVIKLPPPALDSVLTALRESYSGRYTRNVGSEGGRMLQWRGKLACFAGCTGVIDSHQETSTILGERFIYCRMPASEDWESWERSKRTLDSKPHDWRDGLRETVQACFAGQGMEFGNLEKRREFDDSEKLRIHRLARFLARGRSATMREVYNNREIIAATEAESETRLVAIFGQLYAGMEAMGVADKERWASLKRVTVESMPRLRQIAMERILSNGRVSKEYIRGLSGCGAGAAARVIEDMKVYGLIAQDGESYGLSDWTREVTTEWQQ